MDFEIQAERLMAATYPNFDGSVGMDWMEWKDRYMNSSGMDKERAAIAEWLKGFYNEVIRDAQEKMAMEEHERIRKELERYNKIHEPA